MVNRPGRISILYRLQGIAEIFEKYNNYFSTQYYKIGIIYILYLNTY